MNSHRPGRSYDGFADLEFINRSGKTVLTKRMREGNSRISSLIPTLDGTPLYFLVATGGGYIEGEQYYQQITMQEQTHAILTSQAPNYIFKCEHDQWTKQSNHLILKDDAFLEYYMDEVIPYENALFRQETRVDMKKGARLVLTDGITAGWSQDTLPFTFKEVDLKTQIYMDNELIFNDFLITQPKKTNLEEFGYFEGYSNFNSLVIIDENYDEAWLTDIRNTLATSETDSIYGLSSLESSGFVMRVLGNSSYANRKLIWQVIHHYREQVYDHEHLELRKTY